MVHLQTIKWHDLIENPEDLPSETGYYMLSIYHAIDRVSFVSHPYEGLFCDTDYAKYDSDEKAWVVIDYDAEFGVLFSDCAPFLKIIAWAEPVEPYEKEVHDI